MARDYFQFRRVGFAAIGAILYAIAPGIDLAQAETHHRLAMFGSQKIPSEFVSRPHVITDAR